MKSWWNILIGIFTLIFIFVQETLKMIVKWLRNAGIEKYKFYPKI